MPRFSANISTMFTEHPLLARFEKTKTAGFEGVEFQFPYDTDIDKLATAVQACGLPVTVFNHANGDLPKGGAGIAALPGAEDEFKSAIDETCRYADRIKPLNVNILAGWPPEKFPRELCLETLAENLRLAAAALADISVGTVVEAVNTRDRPGYLISSTRQAVAIVERAGHANLKIEYDLYHAQIMEGDLIPTMQEFQRYIGHIQFADTPGRHEPGTGEINFPVVFEAIDEMGFDGYLAAEYHPAGATADSLSWLEPYR